MDGFAIAGETPESLAEQGFNGDVEALYEFVVLGLRGINRNGDAWICGKPFPDHENGSLPYFFNATDGNAAQH